MCRPHFFRSTVTNDSIIRWAKCLMHVSTLSYAHIGTHATAYQIAFVAVADAYAEHWRQCEYRKTIPTIPTSSRCPVINAAQDNCFFSVCIHTTHTHDTTTHIKWYWHKLFSGKLFIFLLHNMESLCTLDCSRYGSGVVSGMVKWHGHDAVML